MAYDIAVYNDSGILTFTQEPVMYVNRGTASSGTRPSGVTGQLAVRATNASATIYRTMTNTVSGTFVTSDGGTYDWIELVPSSNLVSVSGYGFSIKNQYNTITFDSNHPPPSIAYNASVNFSGSSGIGSTINVSLSTSRSGLKYYIAESSLKVCVFIGATNGHTRFRLILFNTTNSTANLTVSSDFDAIIGATGNYLNTPTVPILIFQA